MVPVWRFTAATWLRPCNVMLRVSTVAGYCDTFRRGRPFELGRLQYTVSRKLNEIEKLAPLGVYNTHFTLRRIRDDGNFAIRCEGNSIRHPKIRDGINDRASFSVDDSHEPVTVAANPNVATIRRNTDALHELCDLDDPQGLAGAGIDLGYRAVADIRRETRLPSGTIASMCDVGCSVETEPTTRPSANFTINTAWLTSDVTSNSESPGGNAMP